MRSGRPPWPRPNAVLGDRAYSSRGDPHLPLRTRGIKAVVPEPADQQGYRKRRGSRGGRPVVLDTNAYKGRNVIERQHTHLKQWQNLPDGATSTPSSSGPLWLLIRCTRGRNHCQTRPRWFPGKHAYALTRRSAPDLLSRRTPSPCIDPLGRGDTCSLFWREHNPAVGLGKVGIHTQRILGELWEFVCVDVHDGAGRIPER